jgi:hypothetical protein
MAKNAAARDVVGLEQAKRTDRAVRKARRLLDGLPAGLRRQRDLFHRSENDDPAPQMWAAGLRELVEGDWQVRLDDLHAAVNCAHQLLENLWVEIYGLRPGSTGQWEHWHPKPSPPRLTEHVVELLNALVRAKEHCSGWDWNARALKRAEWDGNRFTRDRMAQTVAHYISELGRELNVYLRELFNLAAHIERTCERNAVMRGHARERALASTKSNGASQPSIATAATDGHSAPHIKRRSRAVIEGERLQAPTWSQCKLVLTDVVTATLKSGGDRRAVALSGSLRCALELLATQVETDFGKRTAKRARSTAVEVRKLLRSIFEVPGGEPVPNVGKGRYTAEFILSTPQ